MNILFAFVIMLLPLAAQAQTQQFVMEWPVKCIPNVSCFVAKYPDLNAGQDFTAPLDYMCGNRTEHNNKGTVLNFADRKQALGKEVLAVADGVVTFTENRVNPHIHYNPDGRFACGNRVVIDHQNGYTTKYCHMKKGSVAVKEGDTVKAGAVLGLTGQTGAISRPRFAFYVEKNGVPIDPFANQPLNKKTPCFSARDRSLWREAVAYPPVGIISTGFADHMPQLHQVEKDIGAIAAPEKDDDQMVSWIRLYGIEEGDRDTFKLFNPEGEEVANREQDYKSDRRVWLTTVEHRTRRGFEPGRWKAEYTLIRRGDEVLTHSFYLTIAKPKNAESETEQAEAPAQKAAPHSSH